MGVIQTAVRAGTNPYDYLVDIQRNFEHVRENPVNNQDAPPDNPNKNEDKTPPRNYNKKSGKKKNKKKKRNANAELASNFCPK